jgi:NitT/TauT family transport system substrate-binding protein
MVSGQGSRRCSALVASLVALGLVGLSGSAMPAAPDKLRFSIGIDPVMSLTVVAKETGIFKKYNIEAEVIQAESGGAALEMTVAGQTDAATTTELPGVRARTKGAKIVIPAALAAGNGIFAIVASNAIQKPADVSGKRIGVAKGTQSEFLYQRFLEVYKIPRDSPKVTFISGQEMIPALIRKDLDAVVAWEPWVSKALDTAKSVGAHAVVRGSQQLAGLDQELTLFLYVQELVAKNKDLTERILNAYLDAEDFVQSKPAVTRKIVSDSFRLSPALVDSIFTRTRFGVNLNQSSVNGLKVMAKWMLENGLIDREPDWDGFVQPKFMKAIRPDRVS